VDLNDIVREAKRSNARRGDFNSRSNRGRDSFRGRGDFRLEPFIFGLFTRVSCGRRTVWMYEWIYCLVDVFANIKRVLWAIQRTKMEWIIKKG